MVRRNGFQRMHDVRNHDYWDKIVLALAFLAGVGGGIALKLLGVHPFVAAGYSASILCLYALVSYVSTSLRLDPEVIGDNTYYLGFLLTLTSLSVTLYFVVESGAEERAELIPEVISGFGVALVSTIFGVFIRVLMMQFRVDIVSRERETRVELDQLARRLRIDLAQSLQQMQNFGVESLQRAAEREARMAQATETLVSETRTLLEQTITMLQRETTEAFRVQTGAAIDAIRSTVSEFSTSALAQVKLSFEEIARTSEGLRANHMAARTLVDQNNVALQQQTGNIVELLGQLAKRIRSVSDEVETSGTTLSKSFAATSDRFDAAIADSARRLETTLKSFEDGNRSAAARAQLQLMDMETRLATSSANLAKAAEEARAQASAVASVAAGNLDKSV